MNIPYNNLYYSSPSIFVADPFALSSSPVATTSAFPDFNSSTALAIFVFASSLRLGFSFGIPTPFSLIPKICSPLVNLPSLISLAGFYFEKELPKMADAFPDKKYIFIDGVVEKANVASVTFAEQEAGYLAGYAAALQSKTGKVGFIGGAKIPTVARFGIGFVQGAKAANKDIKVVYNYSGSFSDTNKGKTIAATMYDTGADVIFVAAGGTGNGAIKEAQERATQDLKESGEIKHWIVGVDKDQYTDGIFKAKDKDGKDVEKSVVVASVIKRVDVAVKNVLDSIKEGKFEGGKEHIFTIKEDGIELTLENPNLNEETKSKIKNKIAELKAGKETVVAEADKLTDKNNIDGEL